MLITGILALEQEVLVIEDNLTVNILHQNPESLRATMNLLIPLEVWSDGQFNLKGAPKIRPRVIAKRWRVAMTTAG